MRITVITPLFPPDIGAPAPYVKTLLQKLNSHQVHAIIYGHLPESVPNITYTTIDKRSSKFVVLLKAIWEIYHAGKNCDLIIINNGLSTELPTWLVSYFIRTPILLCLSDQLAKQASEFGLYKQVHQLLKNRITGTIELPTDEKLFLPIEKLPFASIDDEMNVQQNTWWIEHVAKIESYVK
jgi:hypothetical protein